MDSRAAIIVSVWFAVTFISVVYMFVFANKVGDVLFGVFLPIGFLILIALIVTFGILSRSAPQSKT